MANWDVSKYRHPAEPAHHWELKKTFMESIKHMFPEQRVACLAQTLGNIEFMGCRYPKDVMEQVKELSGSIVEEFREKRGDRIQRTFVSGSAAANSKVNRKTPSYGSTAQKRGPDEDDPPSSSKRTKYGNFVSASDSTEDSEKEKVTEGFILPPLNRKKSPERRVRIENPSSFLSETSSMPGLDRDDREELDARRTFKMPQYQYDMNSRQQLRFNYDFPVYNFIVVKLAYREDENASNILQRSAGFSKMNVHWDYRGSTMCYVQVNNHVICEEAGDSKPEARDAACRRALEILCEKCYTVYIKNQFLSDGSEVDLIDVEDNTKVGGKKEALGSSNVGHKLLSLMGWSGGGLGKDGAGIAEPITAKTVFGREGLGASVGVGKNFRQKI